MNGIYKALRGVTMVFSIIVAVLFGFCTLVFLPNIFSGSGEERPIWIGVTAISAMICFFSIRSFIKHRRRATNMDHLMRQSQHTRQTGKMLGVSRACPDCGRRLAVCQRGEPLRLQTLSLGKRFAENEYYCLTCQQRYPAQGSYAAFEAEARPLPDQSGPRYRAAGGFLFVYGILPCLLFLLLGLAFLRGTLTSAAMASAMEPGFGGVVFVSGLLAAVLLLGAVTMALSLSRLMGLSYEVLEQGIILREGKKAGFYSWEDFRLATRLERHFRGRDSYVFDLEQRVLTIDCGLRDYEGLADAILEKIGGRVSLTDSPRLG